MSGAPRIGLVNGTADGTAHKSSAQQPRQLSALRAGHSGRELPQEARRQLSTIQCVAGADYRSSKMRKVLQRYSASDASELGGRPPLCLAAWMGDVDSARQLIRSGADVNQQSWEGYSPLCLAALNGHVALTAVLIEAGAQLNATTPAGSTALCLAVRKGHKAVAHLLIKSGASLDHAGEQSLSPLCLASLNGSTDTVSFLLASGASADPKGCQSLPAGDAKALPAAAPPASMPALCLAVWHGNADVVRALVQSGADVACSARDGVNPLYLACRKGSLEITQTLLAAGAPVDAASATGDRPLHAALRGGFKPLVHALLNAGADCGLLQGATRQELLRLGQWQSEMIRELKAQHEKLIYGIGHMLSSVSRGPAPSLPLT